MLFWITTVLGGRIEPVITTVWPSISLDVPGISIASGMDLVAHLDIQECPEDPIAHVACGSLIQLFAPLNEATTRHVIAARDSPGQQSQGAVACSWYLPKLHGCGQSAELVAAVLIFRTSREGLVEVARAHTALPSTQVGGVPRSPANVHCEWAMQDFTKPARRGRLLLATSFRVGGGTGAPALEPAEWPFELHMPVSPPLFSSPVNPDPDPDLIAILSSRNASLLTAAGRFVQGLAGQDPDQAAIGRLTLWLSEEIAGQIRTRQSQRRSLREAASHWPRSRRLRLILGGLETGLIAQGTGPQQAQRSLWLSTTKNTLDATDWNDWTVQLGDHVRKDGSGNGNIGQIVAEHMLEHLTLHEAHTVLQHACRILRPRKHVTQHPPDQADTGWVNREPVFRLAVPDSLTDESALAMDAWHGHRVR